MKNEKLKIALIGTGRIGAEPSERLKNILPNGWLPLSHAESILSNEDLQLVALCDMDIDRLKRHSIFYSIENVFTDFKKMIQEVKPDLISIATRTEGRTEIIKFAIENGVKGIYFEKPIARSLSDCISTLELCKQNNIVVQYGTTRRYMPIYQKAKEIIQTGEIGSLVEIIIEYGAEKVLWTHPHFSDLLIYFSGSTEIEYIQGNCNQFNYQSDLLIDDDPIILNSFIKFSNGIFGSIKQSTGSNVRLCGTTGTITIHSDGAELEIRKQGSIPGIFSSKNITLPEKSLSGTQQGFIQLVNSVKKNKVVSISNEEIKSGLEILLGIIESSIKGGIKITPSEINPQRIITGKSGNFYA